MNGTESAATWEPASSLLPWSKNPRVNEEAAEAVARSIVRFGFGSPLVARSESREVIAGHSRLKAVALLREWWSQESEADRTTWSADARRLATEPEPRVPVRFLDLPESEAHALALADNKLGELAGWSEGLEDVLRGLASEGVSLDGLGFEIDELTSLLTTNREFVVPDGEKIEDPKEKVSWVVAEIRIPPAVSADVLSRVRALVSEYERVGVVLNVA